MAGNSQSGKILAYFFAGVSILWALLMPNVVLNLFWDIYVKFDSFHRPLIYHSTIAVIWILFVILSLKFSKWDKRFYWLFVLFPFACRYFLLGVFLFLIWSIFGFAP